VALLLLAASARLLVWVVGRVVRQISGIKVGDATGMAGIQFYRRLLQLLSEYGLERPPAETPREFARRAAIFLAGHGSGTEAVADVPPLVVDAFYQIRFGDQTMAESDFERVNARLDALEARLHPAKA
jgi:protein-glutamine gamma-glutamyltransferase